MMDYQLLIYAASNTYALKSLLPIQHTLQTTKFAKICRAQAITYGRSYMTIATYESFSHPQKKLAKKGTPSDPN